MWPDNFDDWYIWAYPSVFGSVHRSLRRRGLPEARAGDLAEEATQEATRRAADRIQTPRYFGSQEHLRNWMITVARRCATDLLRRERMDQWHEGHEQAQRPSREEFFGAIWECFQQLSAEDQRILDGYYWDQMTDVEIGRLLSDSTDCSSAALGQRARRLRLAAAARLRESLLLHGIDPQNWNFDAPSGRR